jgi:thiol-disulfide isomerase/thioredoxin
LTWALKTLPALPVSALRRLVHYGLRYGSSLGIFLFVLIGIHLWQTKDFQSNGLPAAFAQTEFVLLEPNKQARTVLIKDLIAELRAENPSRPVALYLWAEWCSICKIQESSLQSLHQDHSVVSVAVQSGGPERVSQVLKDRSLSLRTLVDPSGQWLSELGLRAVPSFMVITERNELDWVTVGYTTEIGMRLRLWLDQIF